MYVFVFTCHILEANIDETQHLIIKYPEPLQVGTVRKPKPPLLAAALSAWTFLLTTIGSWRINTDSWKECASPPVSV